MQLVGYARVSSVGQSLEVQVDKLTHCNKLFQEKASGNLNQRPQLQACLEYVREDDTLIVTRLDRLARSTLHLCQIADAIFFSFDNTFHLAFGAYFIFKLTDSS